VQQGSAGRQLKHLRMKAGLTLRDVASRSQLIADEYSDPAYLISHPLLLQIEHGRSAPSIHRLVALCAIYGVPVNDLLSEYCDLQALRRLHGRMNMPSTHLLELEADRGGTPEMPLPRLSGFQPVKTSLLNDAGDSQRKWAEFMVPNPPARGPKYVLIGSHDFTMYPLLRPGSIALVDQTRSLYEQSRYPHEFERPIYLIETRTGYICSWCELEAGRLSAVPHPMSGCKARHFAHPRDAEIVGRVVALVLRLDDSAPASRAHPPQFTVSKIPRDLRPPMA
jgi:transcriptional regulator with XRE-family HTH domain